MKRKRYVFIMALTVLTTVGCTDFLDVKPVDRITPENITGSIEGMTAFLADLYYNAPVEDFNLSPDCGFNFNGVDANNGACNTQVMDDDGIGSERDDILRHHHLGWWENTVANRGGNTDRGFDRGPWKLNRDIIFFLSLIDNANITDAEKKSLTGEAYFLRAYLYFALAKRYGGVPIITDLADVDNIPALFVPRSTEKETWDFVMTTCDKAATYLEDYNVGPRRASKWAALALKSRAALHAASVAKYWKLAPQSGEAVTNMLAKLEDTEAERYYKLCIEASKEIIENGPFELYMPTPATAEEAEKNYSAIFDDPNQALVEVIFLKGSPKPGAGTGTSFDGMGNPMQTAGSWPHPCRFNPTLELADIYECYSNPGVSAPIVTTNDGMTGDDYDNGYEKNRTYIKYTNPTDLFADKDARMKGTMIIPFSYFKNVQIVIQGGFIKPDGTLVKETAGQIIHKGKTYYTYGGATPTSYSGFATEGGNYTRTGFCLRKLLRTDFVPTAGWSSGSNDWIDMRLAEVFLNYAEAVIEIGETTEYDGALAAINRIRRRAAFTGAGLYLNSSQLTLENILRERRVELVYENFRYWDLIRRREFHTLFDKTYRHALVPILDLTGAEPKYIFVRQKVSHTNAETYPTKGYYKEIPGTATNRLIQNPQY